MSRARADGGGGRGKGGGYPDSEAAGRAALRHVVLPVRGTFEAWRGAARQLAGAGVPASDVAFVVGEAGPARGLFEAPLPEGAAAALVVPRGFLDLAAQVLCHRDAEAPALLYALLLRLQDQRGLLGDPADPLVRRIEALAKAVRRDIHKMRAFVRFRELPAPGPRRRFAAWFEPDHRIVERNAPFFARRFADMDWAIHTPDLSAVFEGGALRFTEGAARPDLPEDAHEALWATYFANIFNPARIKLAAMRSEMPLKYWKNMPETGQIPAMLAAAEARVQAMRVAAALPAPARAATISARYRAAMPQAPGQIGTLAEARAAAALCTRCDLCRHATQTVFGEGAGDAVLMIVGEQPGDQEDLAGRPFVGPAGQVLDRAMAEAGLERSKSWLTNAVKHFKFAPRGKQRLHQRPDAGEVQACRWWLDQELRLIAPRLTVAMGATAALALIGPDRRPMAARRGRIEDSAAGPVLLTWHPSFILRLSDSEARKTARAEMVADLAAARRITGDG